LDSELYKVFAVTAVGALLLMSVMSGEIRGVGAGLERGKYPKLYWTIITIIVVVFGLAVKNLFEP